MKFIHTADWQIGMPAAQFGTKAPQVREARFASLERLVAIARERGADFIVVAGDVFDDLAVPEALVQRVARTLAAFEGPVFLLPGNHDPAYAASLWRRQHLWSDALNVHPMLESEPITIAEGVTLFPCPISSKHGTQDATQWIAQHLDIQGFRIGVAHGGLRGAGVGDDELNFPIARDAAERMRLDYLALGDWHGYLEFPDAAGAIRTVYSGTHERTAFDDKNPGNIALVEISAPGAAPRVTPISVGELEWRLRTQTDLSADGLTLLCDELRALHPRERHIVRLVLDGTLRADAMQGLTALRALAAAGFLWFDIDDSTVRSAPDDDRWIDVLPIGALRNVARDLGSRAASESASMDALELLYDIADRQGVEVSS
ncbi:MAG TPA: DNA repair exonuclease [Candidatus Baltobacteraceae bacterium]|nr:DNA repair exonuclease [Candidatus Baltobacteraceae bacterium]